MAMLLGYQSLPVERQITFRFDGTACGSIKSEMRALGLVVAAGTFRLAVPAKRNVL
jgi:hypothetical protein